jgi:hypothetical protein
MRTRTQVKHAANRLTDLARWQMTVLAKNGGFSHRYIARYVFGYDEPSDDEIQCVSGYLHRSGIKLAWWRNGESPLATRYAAKAAKQKRRNKRR